MRRQRVPSMRLCSFFRVSTDPDGLSLQHVRMFSRVDTMYGRDQLCVLGDQLQAAGSDAAVQHEAHGSVG